MINIFCTDGFGMAVPKLFVWEIENMLTISRYSDISEWRGVAERRLNFTGGQCNVS